MRTEILYMPDIEANYIRDFEAKVLAKGTDHVVLDRTAFYAEGGGQPSDTGTLTWDDGKGGTASAKVLVVRKMGDITHHLEGPVPDVGTAVHGMLDWDRRWGHMRMHTSQHILSAVIFAEKKASTVDPPAHTRPVRPAAEEASFSISAEDFSSLPLGGLHLTKSEPRQHATPAAPAMRWASFSLATALPRG